MAINTNKRSTLKVIAMATGATIAPSIAIAACNHGVNKDVMASTSIRGTGLVVSFGEKSGIDGTRQVVVTNTGDQAVTLSHIYPGIVSTPDGPYDLNSLLVNGPVKFEAKQDTTLSIKVAQTDQLDFHRHPMRTADSLIHVRTTNENVNGGRPVTTTRELFS